MASASPPTDTDIEPPEEAYENDQPAKDWISLLQAPTPETEIHGKPVFQNRQPVMNQDGTPKTLAYITARFVQDRLDQAVGPSNWQVMYESVPNSLAVRAGIGLAVGDGEGDDAWIWKWDVGTPSSIEPEKGAHSDAFKRAAVQWGIARDLYDERDDKEGVEPWTGQQAQAAQQVYGAAQQPVQQQPYMDAPIMPRGAQQTIQQQVQQPVQQPIQQAPYVENGQQPSWACPIHSDVKIVPGGVSKRTGRAYAAFYACPIPGCDQKGPSA